MNWGELPNHVSAWEDFERYTVKKNWKNEKFSNILKIALDLVLYSKWFMLRKSSVHPALATTRHPGSNGRVGAGERAGA